MFATLVAYFIGKRRKEAERREEAGEDDEKQKPAG
jgi:hypothetical protein